MNRSLVRASFVIAAIAAFTVPAVAQDGGPPFQVNAFTANTQNSPAVGTDAAGRFVVAWQSQLQDGSDYGIIARGFEANGAPRTGEVQANALTTMGRQFQPAIAVVPDGGYFVAWTDGFTAQEVWLRRYTADGIPLLPEQQVNISLFVFGDQRSPSLDADANGNIVVVWESQNGAGSPNWTINARRYNAAGVPVSGELQISQTTSGDQHKPVVAVDPQGNFVVTWEALGADGNGNAVLARLFNAAGSPLGNQFLVNQTVAGNQERSWVDRDALGGFVVAWQSNCQTAGDSCDVFARRFDAAGNPLGNEFRTNTQTFWLQQRPAVAKAPDGRFVVVWQSGSQDGPSWGTFGQRYDANGATVGPEFQVNTVTVGHQYQPAVAAQPGGGFIVTWAQQEPTGVLFDVWARVYPPFGVASDLIFADGFETGNLSRWSTASTDSGDLSVTPQAALAGTFGLQAVVDDTTGVYVQDNSPNDEPRYRARFKFHPNSFDPGELSGARRTRIFIAFEEGPNRRLVTIVLRRIAGLYAVQARVQQDNGSRQDTPFIPISNAPHTIEFDWKKATGDNSFDGRLELWIDGVSQSTFTNLDTFINTVDMGRMGALSVKAGANGVLFFDAFESRRLSYIGP